MPDWTGAGKSIVLIGVVLVLVGGVMAVVEKNAGEGNWLGWLGRLPGDIQFKRDSFSFYFPLTTSILISAILSGVVYLLSLLKR
ncbi:MAG TPA: DUF2905 domain-containing protein [Nitrospiraceae bacterium]|nr:DUF2905 domain-containing protein [Nitrospiraceae bacterium]